VTITPSVGQLLPQGKLFEGCRSGTARRDRRDNDIVLTRSAIEVGTSCCTHDGIRLEALGRPTAIVVTTEFLHERRCSAPRSHARS